MIDIHCHIIPSVDDGSTDMQCSIDMAKIAYKDGVRKIIATPHYYRNYFEHPFHVIEKKTKELNEELKKIGINLKIFPGQEIFLDSHLLELYRDEGIKPLNKKRYMLLETDFQKFPKHVLSIIYELKILGITTIIAHPERYLYVQNQIKNLNPFIEEGCLFQLNTTSIMGFHGKKTAKTAKRLIEQGLCDFVASDAHGLHRRSPKLSPCYDYIHKKYPELYKPLLRNAEAVLDGEDMGIKHKIIKNERRGFLHIFK